MVKIVKKINLQPQDSPKEEPAEKRAEAPSESEKKSEAVTEVAAASEEDQLIAETMTDQLQSEAEVEIF
jgi:hypothetical protein